MQTLYPYEAQGDGELSFEAGAYIGVLEVGPDWSRGELWGTNLQGYYPTSYVVDYVPEGGDHLPPHGDNTQVQEYQEEIVQENQTAE